MRTAIAYSEDQAAYSFGESHPMRAERFTRAVGLISTFGLLDVPLDVVAPGLPSEDELELAHDAEYVGLVRNASSADPHALRMVGLGPGDTPVFPRMHEAASLAVGGTLDAMRLVMSGEYDRAFSIAGGLHHAHRDHASGFCIYNDIVVAIRWAFLRDPTLRIAYLDIDAHHGDGVEDAFYDDPRVLTISLHQSGRTLFPGTGFVDDRGFGDALGTSVNVPLPPGAGDACYSLAFDRVVEPALRAFSPDILVTQNGADCLAGDPLTMLRLSLCGFADLQARISALARELCGGRLVATGGGGYAWESNVPRAWAIVSATLAGIELPHRIPEGWLRTIPAGIPTPTSMTDLKVPSLGADTEAALLAETERTAAALLAGDGPWSRSG